MLSLVKAKKAIEAAELKAKELNIAISTVIVDEHGAIIIVSRMDNSIPISPKFAYTKAFTSAVLGLSTGDIAPYAVPEKPYFGINSIFGGELTTIAGGLPVKIDNKLVGGVGVGGSMSTVQDIACAQEAVKILTS